MPTTALATSALDRFLRYVTYDTQSAEGAEGYPSTAKQLALLDRLVEELRELGVPDAARSADGVVMGTVPATSKKGNVPVIGFIAHVDTSPEESGAGVKPIVHENWQGEDIVLPDDRSIVLRASEIPALREQIGNDIVTASGTTLLGADNKAGVAAIMAAVEHLMSHPEIAHGTVRIGFTPDEEIGRGADRFDVKAFGAFCAYTMDGEGRGRLESETFSADALVVTFKGFNTHPGFAKDQMVNSIKAAADFVSRLPRQGMSPETTEGRQGFVHPNVIEGGVGMTTVRFIVRDFETTRLAEMEAQVERLARETAADWPGVTASSKVKESYRNMREMLAKFPQVVENAREAIRRTGLPLRETAIRGGTDGSRLSFMGLPTPNLFAGENNFHSKLEWVSAQDMEKSAETIVHLCRIFEEKAEIFGPRAGPSRGMNAATPSDRPVMLFDGDCAFCRDWVARFEGLTRGAVVYVPYQQVADDFPEIALAELRAAVQLVEPGGRRTQGAEAVFRALAFARRQTLWLWLYERLPPFAALARWGYRQVARHRSRLPHRGASG